MEYGEFEPEFSDQELETGAHNTLARVIAGIAGISLTAASVIVAKKIYEAKKEAKQLNKEDN